MPSLPRSMIRAESSTSMRWRHPLEEQVMTKMFIGGSRRVTRLNADVQRRIDKIIEQGFAILVGDANGADKAVQTYLRSRRYHKVDVFCTGGDCRNNVGDWPISTVPAPAGSRGLDYYAVKDDRMAEEASAGLMIWDSKSVGTLMNMDRLRGPGAERGGETVPPQRCVSPRATTAPRRHASAGA